MFRVFTSTDNPDGYPVKETVCWTNSALEAHEMASLNPDWFFEYDSNKESEAMRAMRVSAYFS